MNTIIKEDEFRIITIEPPEIYFPKEDIVDPVRGNKHYIVKQREIIEEKVTKRMGKFILPKYEIEITALMREGYLRCFPNDYNSVMLGLFAESEGRQKQNNLLDFAKSKS
jgi:hypothetical protein